MKCPKCNGDLIYRCQPWIEMQAVILKNGKVSSKLRQMPAQGQVTISAPEWIECTNPDCGAEWEYTTDENERVTLTTER